MTGEQSLLRKLDKGVFLLSMPDEQGGDFVSMKASMFSRLFRAGPHR